MKTFRKFTEDRIKTIVVTFGRFNPPHIGHQENIEKVAELAKQFNADFRIYVSQSEDQKKNPLGYEEKIKFMRQMFPTFGRNIILDKNIRSIFDVASRVYEEGYTRLIGVFGSDQTDDFESLLHDYNGIKSDNSYYHFKDGIDIISSGKREDDVDEHTGKKTFKISSSKMKSAAATNDFQAFNKFLPKTFGGAKELFDAVRKGMGLKESTIFKNHIQLESIGDKREQYVLGKIFNIGDIVYKLNEQSNAQQIVERGPNFVVCRDSLTGQQNKFFINSLTYIQQ